MKIVTQALTLTGAETESLTEDLSRWLSEHQPQVEELLKQRDVDQSGSVTEEDFQLGNSPQYHYFQLKLQFYKGSQK